MDAGRNWAYNLVDAQFVGHSTWKSRNGNKGPREEYQALEDDQALDLLHIHVLYFGLASRSIAARRKLSPLTNLSAYCKWKLHDIPGIWSNLSESTKATLHSF